MFPIFSTLRKLAATHIYATKSMYVDVGGVRGINLDRPSSYLILDSCRWSPVSGFAPFSEIRVTGDSPASVAIAVASRENKIAESAGLTGTLYTIVSAQEVEDTSRDGLTTRTVRYVVVRGVFRASSTTIGPAPQNSRRGMSFSRMPEGTVRLD